MSAAGHLADEWWPIIHARTAFADFRPSMLTVPRDFSPADVSWARGYIVAATIASEELGTAGRWVMFCNERWMVVGKVVRASDLSSDMTHELRLPPDGGEPVQGRPLYCFVGFAHAAPAAPAVPSPDAPSYRSAYARYVGARWTQRAGEAGWEEASRSEPQLLPMEPPEKGALEPSWDRRRQLSVWPLDQRRALWHAVATSRDHISLCSGLPTTSHAQRSPFDVVTVADVSEPAIVDRRLRPASDTTIDSGRTRTNASIQEEDSLWKRPPRPSQDEKKKFSILGIPLTPLSLPMIGGATLALLLAILLTVWLLSPKPSTEPFGPWPEEGLVDPDRPLGQKGPGRRQ